MHSSKMLSAAVAVSGGGGMSAVLGGVCRGGICRGVSAWGGVCPLWTE